MERREITKAWKAAKKVILLSNFPLWANRAKCLWDLWEPQETASELPHLRVRELGYLYNSLRHQLMAAGTGIGDCTLWASENFQTKKDWQFKVELVDGSALKQKCPSGYKWNTDSLYLYHQIIIIINPKAIFLFGKKV